MYLRRMRINVGSIILIPLRNRHGDGWKVKMSQVMWNRQAGSFDSWLPNGRNWFTMYVYDRGLNIITWWDGMPMECHLSLYFFPSVLLFLSPCSNFVRLSSLHTYTDTYTYIIYLKARGSQTEMGHVKPFTGLLWQWLKLFLIIIIIIPIFIFSASIF